MLPSRVALRRLATSSASAQRFNVAIVGAGPAGFYTAHHLLTKSSPSTFFNIDFFERLPAPYGLSRYGVAPDHPEVKNCEDYLNNIMSKYGSNSRDDSHRVRFFGNVLVGHDVSLQELHQSYHSLVLAYGCTTADNHMEVPGAQLPGVISARQFVNWYNGHPDFYATDSTFVPPPLDQIESVSIIGNGNVAVDVARILLADPAHWAPTDISTEALQALKSSTVKNVNIVARRGVLESAFSNKEIRELFELPKNGSNVQFAPVDSGLLESIDKKSLGRVDKRKVSIIEKYSVPLESSDSKVWSLQYLKSPVEFTQSARNDQLLESITFAKNQLVHDELTNQTKVISTNETETIKTDLVILSIGYKGSPLDDFEEMGVLFDRNRLLNKEGRILSTTNENDPNAVYKKGWYTSGWIKNGPSGVIATTMMDSFDTADKILEDLSNGIHLEPTNDGIDGGKLKEAVNWNQWEKLDKYELEKGGELGKTRLKICNKQEMLEIAES
ncbi:nucleotide-binding domain-containing protein [Suhomyces tanzawaensis NRRL Y-17324]|uniref:NADPH:adrenodoxin oxidoreductase, mitochondrial n=1 Tax=Suhomyces tanzawaensis NRRL Y-17324 TaxID=984487 RepID=A0A1E4SQA3_9ASCO|nr:nucleotide-binding domain-containing protein [Suhomyces tanzawaensis NRRL Y-17324]ODV81686.1 nucleotide-binding domain-containing protein [Suhomyces tanzawaensis NRRL Y-17324]